MFLCYIFLHSFSTHTRWNQALLISSAADQQSTNLNIVPEVVGMLWKGTDTLLRRGDSGVFFFFPPVNHNKKLSRLSAKNILWLNQLPILGHVLLDCSQQHANVRQNLLKLAFLYVLQQQHYFLTWPTGLHKLPFYKLRTHNIMNVVFYVELDMWGRPPRLQLCL